MDDGMPPPKSLVLILARELASNVAVPLFVVDSDGTLVYYNEPAEEVLGTRFADVGPLGVGEWGALWEPTDPSGRPLALDELPLVIATRSKRPAHVPMRITQPTGGKADIEVTAFPLFARRDEFVGAVAIFWDGK